MSSIRGEIRGFLATELKRSLNGVSDSQSLLEAGVIDSMAVIELVGLIETKYGIAIGDDDMMPENFDSIDAMVRFIEERRGRRS